MPQDHQSTLDSYRALWSLFCQGHQACLVTRPIIEESLDYSTCLVRLCHVLEGGRKLEDFGKALDRAVDDIYAHMEAPSLPEQSRHHMQASATILKGTRSVGAKGLSDETITSIVAHDNGDWGDEGTLVHLCVRGECPSGCRDAKHGKHIAKDNVRELLGNSYPEPLLYRWKNMDIAMAYVIVGRLMHKLLDAAIAHEEEH